jgi:hypothetical protein
VLLETDKFPTQLSCAEAAVSAPQSIVANIMAGTAVVSYLYNILVLGDIETRSVTFSTKTVNLKPVVTKKRRRKAAQMGGEKSMQSQKKNMKAIFGLVSGVLSYYDGAAAKKQFHTKSKAFLRALAKDLGFKEFTVKSNAGGIAVSGEITLMGLWSEGNGVYFQLFQSVTNRREFMYRHISHMKDYRGGANQWMDCRIFEAADYERVLEMLLALRNPAALDGAVNHHAA